MTLDNFWQIIDLSWKDSPEIENLRQQALTSNDEELLAELSIELSETVLNNYKNRLAQLSKDDLTSFIHHLEERMYHIDREEIHENTDGSDDGFLYCRCFVVGMGKEYYNKIDQDPSQATMDLEAEEFGFSAYQVYEKTFGEEFERYTHHSMESGSNPNGWNA